MTQLRRGMRKAFIRRTNLNGAKRPIRVIMTQFDQKGASLNSIWIQPLFLYEASVEQRFTHILCILSAQDRILTSYWSGVILHTEMSRLCCIRALCENQDIIECKSGNEIFLHDKGGRRFQQHRSFLFWNDQVPDEYSMRKWKKTSTRGDFVLALWNTI